MIIKTTSGLVQGYQEKNLILFKGIPYATAKRFMAPSKIEWDGVLNATSFGKKAPQIEKGSIRLENISEDCLTLNIYTPSLDCQLPVLVEVHGGAFQTGSNQSMNPFHVIQNDQFVYVTINYRLGVFGYLYLEDYPTSGNNGTLDQIAALEWIKDNIANFGGNPNQITVLGSSAGAKSLGAVMGHSKAVDLFSQAILISGAYQSVRSIQTANKVTQRYFDILKIHHSDELLSLDLHQLLQAQQELCKGNSTCLFGPVSDDGVISKDYYNDFHTGKYWHGNIMLGSSLHELVFYEWTNPSFVNDASHICQELFGTKSNIAIDEANRLSKIMPLPKAFTKVLSDGMYRTYTYKMAQEMAQQGNVVYQYSMHLFPACHVLDHLVALCPKEKYQHFFKDELSLNTAMEVGKKIRKAYISFVQNGHPDCEEWNDIHTSNHQMIFDTDIHLEKIDMNDVCLSFEDDVYQ